MYGRKIDARSSNIRSRSSGEVARFFNSQDRPLGGSSQKRPQGRRRSLRIEPLELRCLMDAAGLASSITPTWFQDGSNLTGPQHAGAATWTAEDTITPAQNAAASPSAASNLYDWIVQFNTASLANITSVAQTASLLVGGGIQFEVIRGLGLAGQTLVRSSGASLDAVENWLSHDLYVAGFEEDAVRQFDMVPNDPKLNQLWGMNKIDAPDAWNISTGSKNVVVAVIDTGVDYTDTDLAANIWTNPGESAGNGLDNDGNGFVNDVHGYDFANNDANPMDDNGHGTHVAGTIAAVGDNGQGVAGVNWSVSIMPLKFLDSQGAGYLSDAIRAVNYATMERTRYGVNVRVMNNSWGGGEFSAAMQTAIQAANQAGILFVAAAGNNGANNDAAAQFPANYDSPNVISVAATDQNDQLASFSNYGATTVDIAAPGVSIYSTIPGNKFAMYSGTSMATPFVSGVAALAWSIDPNATVAEVRNAILGGADPLPGLSGKVASGGRLDAYNTLRLLGGQSQQGPVVASLTASSSSVMAGASVTFAAQGIANVSGSTSGLYLYSDANNNGQCDAGDPIVGSTATIVGGNASVQLNTKGFAPGAYRFFARAVDGSGHWSSAVAATLTVLPADDHGDNAATATAVGGPSSTVGTIGVPGDVDWFKFQATAGQHYTLATVLGTLRDSGLSLYAANGTTLLAANDDYGSSLASRIDWTAPASGTYYLAVAGYGNTCTGTYTLNVQTQNSAPVLPPIADRTMPHSQTTLSIPLGATDADGDPLTYSVVVTAADPSAKSPVYAPVKSGDVSASVSGGVLTITRSAAYTNNFRVQVNVSDGTASASAAFMVSVTNSAPQLAPIADQAMPVGQNSLRVQLTGADSDGDRLTYSIAATTIDPLAQKAYDLDQQLGLYQWCGSYWTNTRGLNEKYIASTTNGLAAPVYILPNGQLYRWGGSIAASTLIATLSPAYYANPSLLDAAKIPTATPIAGTSVTLSMAGNVLTINRVPGYANDLLVQASVSDGVSVASRTFRVSAAPAASMKAAAFIESPAAADLPVELSRTSPAMPQASSGSLLPWAAIPSSTPLLHDDVLASLAFNQESEVPNRASPTVSPSELGYALSARLNDNWLASASASSVADRPSLQCESWAAAD
jgi:subtilisin family serine protease